MFKKIGLFTMTAVGVLGLASTSAFAAERNSNWNDNHSRDDRSGYVQTYNHESKGEQRGGFVKTARNDRDQRGFQAPERRVAFRQYDERGRDCR